MEAKDYLGQIRELTLQVNDLFEKLEELKARSESATGQPWGVRAQSNGHRDRMAAIVAEKVNLEQELLARIEALIDLKTEAMELIGELPDQSHRLLLWNRYLNLKPWNEVALGLGMTLGGCHAMNRRALAELDKILQRKRGQLKNGAT